MEFLGIGYQELLLVLVLLLVVVGPERLPAVAYQLGRAVRTLQTYARAVRDEFSDEIGYVEEQYKTIKGEVDTTRATLRQEEAKLNAELREATEPIRLATEELTKDPALTAGTPASASGGNADADVKPEPENAPPPLVF
ncbi:MAG: twin-arginine translocase subunit TatB [Anaerolinea sp.]|nr:twin-arginine translocase subunit TatB [Anaerolinea sp.]